MEKIEEILKGQVQAATQSLYSQEANEKSIAFQKTKKDFEGDITLVVFPFLKASGKSPEDTAAELGEYLQSNCEEVAGFNVVKGFLNLEIAQSYWLQFFQGIKGNSNYGLDTQPSTPQTVLVEYSSPNTNKPLHLGHIRNNLLGHSISELLQAVGHKVVKVNLVNDRGIHICKSMFAWKMHADGETPESAGVKGDKLVGKYYVLFDQHYKKQVEKLVKDGMAKEEAEKEAPLMKNVQEMLRQWEAGDEEVVKLWEMMNGWVYEGFDVTYKALGVTFDKIYYESNTYLLGKELVKEGLKKEVLFKKDDASVWIDLAADKLDQKLLLRSDGTSVYMTQDLGTAVQRHEEYDFDRMIYTVGNEQDYHFKVLKIILKRLGYKWSEGIDHFSYGMVELPDGKMKSREGTVVDADDLIQGMIDSAATATKELGKIDEFSEEQANELYRTIALGALKYFILKVDPKKKMLFNPEESIDMNGNTGPFIQYSYARIQSVLRKAEDKEWKVDGGIDLEAKEVGLLKQLYAFPEVVQEAAENYSPAAVANYVYELAKEYNQFYHDITILKEEDATKRHFRLALSAKTGQVIESAMKLLGIDVPQRM